MTSKPTDSQELKLGRGWTALPKNSSSMTSTTHPPSHASSRAIGSADPPMVTAAPRIAYTKAELLDLYEPGSTAAIPPDMAKYPGLTSSEPLVPVNIAPDDHIAHVSALVETSDAPPGRQRFQSASSRAGVEAILGRDPTSSVASHSVPFDSSPDHPSSSPPVKKTTHAASSTRDFWAGSAVLAPAERPASSATTSTERQKLALKSRSTAPDRAASPNGHAADKTGLQPPYWSRTATRGVADSKSNWRGGSTANPSIASGGAKYPGSSNDDLNPGSSGGSLQHPTPRKSGGETAISSASLNRSAFPRDRDGAFFSRGKEALKPTNTRDLSALASKGPSRDQPSSSGSFFQDRDTRDSRHTGTDSQHKSHPDIMTDPRKLWFYRDPQGITQGPFPASQLMEWHKAGYYDEELPVSKSREHGFKALAVAFGIRKDDSLSRTPPPGFMKDLATNKKDNGGGGHGMSGRPTREDRNRKMSKTVEEMAEEVEMMRLQKRKHIQEKNAARAVNGIDGSETSFFDESTASTGAVNRRDFLSEAPQDSNDGAREASPTTEKVDEGVASDLLPHQKSNDMRKTGTDGDVKAKSPLKQSRFASFMARDAEESGDESGHNLTASDVERDIGKDNLTPKTAFMQPQDDAPVSAGSEVVIKQLAPKEDPEAIQSSNATSTAWGAMMKSLQQQQHDQTRLAAKEVPTMPANTAEQDLMAIDPAIAHASFARPSVNGSSSASSPRVPPSGADLPPWLQFSSPADLAAKPVSADQPRDMSMPMHIPSHMQSSIGMQATLQNQAQLHDHHARAQTDIQARAEAAAQVERMRQMQAQVQQAQAQQAQARAAAQRASALAQAHAHAQAQAQVEAQVQAQAQLQAHAQASQTQTQTPMQLPSHSQEQTWALKHQLNQYQHRFDLSYRAQLEATRTLQTARRHAAATPVGSVEQRNYLALAAQAEAAVKEHAIHMERIKGAAANAHAQLLQIMAHGPQQQRDLTIQTSQHSPQPGDGISPVSAGHGDVTSPHQSNGNGALPISSGNTAHMSGSEVDMKSTESLSVSEEELVRRNQASVQRNLNEAYDVMANVENSGWERVNRKTKPGIVTTSLEKGTPDALAVEEDQLQANRSASLETTMASQSAVREVAEPPSLKGEVEEPTRKLSEDDARVGQLLSANHSEQQLHAEAAPTVAPWSKPVPSASVNTGPSLREIQRQEELRNEAQEREARTAQLEREETRAAPTRWNPVQPWGGAGDQSKHRTLSLREQIRLEEQKRKKSGPAVTEPANVSGTVTAKTGWALVAKSKPATNNRATVSVVGKNMDDSTPFWDTVSPMHRSSLSGRTQKPAYSQNGQGVAQQTRQTRGSNRPGPLHNGNQQHAVKPQSTSRTGMGEHREKKSLSDGVVVKGRISNEFANWCTENLQKITGNNNQDMTLVEYLVAIKSASEIRETVVQNLGSSDKARSFADEFIRRLEFERSSVVADAGNNGSMGRKKGRRQRGAKVDPSLVLGFTSTSSSSRIMQGTIETPEMK